MGYPSASGQGNGRIIDGTGSLWYGAEVAVNTGHVAVFDPEVIHDAATYENPSQFSVGMSYVLVNDTPVIAEGRMTGELPGKILRGPGYTRQ